MSARPRHPDNVEGPWFVDDACIDCDAVRHVAPTMIGRSAGQAVVTRRPATDPEETTMWRAAITLPDTVATARSAPIQTSGP